MADLNKQFESVMKDLEQNLESKNDVEYVRKTLLNFVQQLNNDIEKRMEILEESQRELEFKANKTEEMINKMKNELYLDEDYEDGDYAFEIACPYCNYTFETDFDELKTEIKCPECNNIIELDWNSDEEGCAGSCSHCQGCDFDDDDM